MITLTFTIQDAKDIAESWVDELIPEDSLLKWGNEFIREKVDSKAWLEAEETEIMANVKANTWTALPDDFYRSSKITSGELLFSDYVIGYSNIKFAADGTYELTYIKYPAELEGISGEGNEVPLKDSFKYPMAEFFLFRYFNLEPDDEDNKAIAVEYEARYKASLKDIYDNMELNTDEGNGFQVQMKW